MFLFRPHKAQYLNLQKKIEALESELSSYLESLSTKSVSFPYAKLHDLHVEINSIRNNNVKALLLGALNEKIVGRLYHYSPKLFPMYQSIQDQITELTANEQTTFDCF
ncbi:hypothetical protein [Legionella maioricensis]|uniref:Uncharacterized protein n=1 Tax=Legionella maioricensis TaxID=2896528 RepID=A0A9X2IB50_9GAMM|nr:hypothetical protein [Legionella maioricensis]MCL9684619.1 hypothetical protein [Legionella maioricensis]MCL9687399.1 hypothetical protein [Legionella maioricensis]